ncbi:MAG: aspartate kinase [Deltaproteobacteria bacterium]|nr:aspartate kinase [Deltaproteobacteria bacterium]
MDKIIQKFGGTSIGNAERMLNVVGIVAQTIKKGTHPIIVLSATSGSNKNEGTTNKLLEASKAAIEGGTYYKIIDMIEEKHHEIIKQAVTDKAIASQVRDEITLELNRLKSFLDAIQVIGEISPRSSDVILGTGEKLSARIFSAILNSHGIDSEFINLDNLVDQDFDEINQIFCKYLQKRLKSIILNCGNRVPVVTGFFGFVPNGILKSIGRGYTDFTAALIAAGLKAKELQIWKEVDGVFSADPHKVKTARVLKSISPDEALELSYYGSEVIHPFTMEQVSAVQVPLRIKNTFNPDLPGTIIEHSSDNNQFKSRATAVTVKRDITVLNLHSNRMLMAYGFMTKVFDVLNRYEIVIDMITTSEVNISMTIDDTHNLTKAIKELEKLGDVSIKKNMAILSLVGQRMKHSVGVAGEMFSRLAESGINIELISQGASEINISCVFEDRYSDQALQSVHKMLE